jgi:autotransporter-associated beta strand protein
MKMLRLERLNPFSNAVRLLPVALAMSASLGWAASTIPFYEPFPVAANPYNTWAYGTGENLGAAGATASVNVWTFGNSASSTSGRITTGYFLSYPGLTNIDSGGVSEAVVTRGNNTSTKDRGVSLTMPSSPGAVYASCLLNLTNLVNNATYPYAFFGLTTNTAGTSVSKNGALVFFDSTGRLQISKNSATPATNTTYPLSLNTTHMVVIRYKFNSGAPDQVDMWLDPVSLGVSDAAIPTPTLTTTNNSNLNSNYFNAVAYFASPNNPIWIFDEVRVATNWAGVTTPTLAPGTIYTVSGGGSGCAGDSKNVNVSGSDSGVNYLLYTNGVFSGQSLAGSGSAITFLNETATARYTVLASNTATAYAGWMNGSASITVLDSPAIATQPVAAAVATNGQAAFNVVATGGGLNYRWYRNGSPLSDSGHYSGTQTATLLVNPATTADLANSANGYYVVITNSCGALVRSVTNGLTLNAPANLVWSGDGVTNVWDVATSPEWNAQTATFNYGDNVLLDDSSANTGINIVQKNLSPSLITLDGTQTYTFTNAGGNFSGPGSILIKGTGTLNLNTPNTLSGGIVVSNGVVSFNNANATGLGTITLAGGVLNAINLASITLNNPVVVTANSTIRVNNTTGSALTMTNTLTGVGGTLTLRNNVSATPSILLTCPNFDFSQPVVIDIGTGAGLNVSGNNTEGTQTFSGVISGAGSIQRNASGGITLLTAANTYSGPTRLINGSIGVGISSVSTSPPTVDSGALGIGTLTIDTGGGTPRIFASGGARSVDNLIAYSSATVGSPFVVSGSNNLTFNGDFDLNTGTRVIQTDNTGKTTFNGILSNGGLTKTGSGTLYLNGNNSYTDLTTVSAGALGGTGTIAGSVIVASGASLAPGASVGTLNISGDLTINGNLAIEVNKSLSPSNDFVNVTGVLTNGGTGTLTVSNLGSALVVGDTFTLFSQPVINGQAMTVSGGGMVWSNKLALDGSITALSVVSSVNTGKTNITFTVSGSTMTLGWPADHTGWRLEAQTNTLANGLKSNGWVTVNGSTSVNTLNVTINPANGAVFYRLVYP